MTAECRGRIDAVETFADLERALATPKPRMVIAANLAAFEDRVVVDETLDPDVTTITLNRIRVCDELREMAASEQVLEPQRFVTICATSADAASVITGADAQRVSCCCLTKSASSWLTEQSRSLSGLTLLDPDWLTDAVYTLLSSGVIRESDAVFDRQLLSGLLRNSRARRGSFVRRRSARLHHRCGSGTSTPSCRGA